MRFIALIEQDPNARAWGAWFPQLPGCVAQAGTLEDVVRQATDALAEWISDELGEGRTYEAEDLAATTARGDVQVAIGHGAVPVYITLVEETGRSVKANLSFDAGLLYAIDEAAKARGLTRSAWIASTARQAIVKGA